MRQYINELQDKLTTLGLVGPLNVMLSGGGIAALRVAQESPILMIESGPAAGAISGAYYGKLTDTESLIAFDMGARQLKCASLKTSNQNMPILLRQAEYVAFARDQVFHLKCQLLI